MISLRRWFLLMFTKDKNFLLWYYQSNVSKSCKVFDISHRGAAAKGVWDLSKNSLCFWSSSFITSDLHKTHLLSVSACCIRACTQHITRKQSLNVLYYAFRCTISTYVFALRHSIYISPSLIPLHIITFMYDCLRWGKHRISNQKRVYFVSQNTCFVLAHFSWTADELIVEQKSCLIKLALVLDLMLFSEWT